MNAPIQILGAGLTGMSAGYHLGEGFCIHERLAHPGGHAITLEERGFRFDRTGHLLHLRDPDIRAWITSLLGDSLLAIARNSRVFSHGVYTRYPYQANTYGLPPRVAYECLTGFLQAHARRDETPPPANFEDFCLKHFGEGFSKHFMIPYNTKLWGVHPREITAEWCSRFVPIPKWEDVIAGAVGLNDRELGYNTNFLYPRRGIGELSEALATTLGDAVHLEHAPLAIDYKARKVMFDDATLDYDVLISSIPLDVLVALLRDPPDAVAQAGRRLRCRGLWYLDVALSVPAGVDIHWAYVPEERYPFYRVGCYSNFSPAMAPRGKACLYVELSGRSRPDMDRLLPEVGRALVEMGFIEEPGQIEFARPRFIEHAYVIFDHAYYEALEAIKPFLEQQRIISLGRYGSWTYASMEDALIDGREAARRARRLQGHA